MTEFGKRVRAARKHATLTQGQLAKALGIKQATVSEMENRGQSSGYTVQIATLCKVSPAWLASGDGEMLDTSHFQSPNVEHVTIRAKVPLISWVSAGELQGVTDVFQPGEAEEWVDVSETSAGRHTFALKVMNDSMTNPHPGQDSFPDGTIIVVDPDRAAQAGDYVIAKDVHTQKATFKKLTYDAGRWYLKPLNPAYPTVEIDDPGIRVIGRIIEAQTRRKF